MMQKQIILGYMIAETSAIPSVPENARDPILAPLVDVPSLLSRLQRVTNKA